MLSKIVYKHQMTKIPNNDVMRTGSGFSSEVLGMHFSVNLLTG